MKHLSKQGIPQSIRDIVRNKQYRLWGFLLVLGSALIILLFSLRPDHAVYRKNADNPLIKVDIGKNRMHQWIKKSNLAMEHVKQSQEHMQRAMKKMELRVNGSHKEIMELSHSVEDIRLLLSNVLRSVHKHPIEKSVMDKQHNGSKILVSHPPETPPNKSALLGWVPMGGFFEAVLLNGIEAGTGVVSQSNPQPVLMRIIGDAFLPNNAKYRTKSCFVLGSSYGSLSTERAFIRISRISCVSEDKHFVISAPVRGYVVDSDGKIGLRGLLINHRGEKLGRAMLSGFFASLSGIAGKIKNGESSQILGDNHHFSVALPLGISVLNGAGSAAKDLASFYIAEAKRLFPVIEVNAGRHVTIDLSQGVSLVWKPIDNQRIVQHVDKKV